MACQMQLKRPRALCTHAQTRVCTRYTDVHQTRPSNTRGETHDVRVTFLRVTGCLSPINYHGGI